MADSAVVRAAERVRALRNPLRRALRALEEVERLGTLDDKDVYGRYVIEADESAEGVAHFVADAQGEYAGHQLEVVVIIGDKPE
jgi:hypothetical protein